MADGQGNSRGAPDHPARGFARLRSAAPTRFTPRAWRALSGLPGRTFCRRHGADNVQAALEPSDLPPIGSERFPARVTAMGNSDLTTAVVVGVVVGLLVVALGHAQLVWTARRRRARDPASPPPSPARTLLCWTAAVGAALCFLRASTGRGLGDRPGRLVAEELFTVRPRPGLVATHETGDADVRRGAPLLRFSGQDGREAQLAMRERRRQLAAQLAAERTRPLDLDAEAVRRADAARAALRDHEQRLKQLASERDAILREGSTQRLALDTRRFRIEQDARDAAGELEPLQASLQLERDTLASVEQLVADGYIARIELARQRDTVQKLEARVHQLGERRALLAREAQELTTLRDEAEGLLDRQVRARAAELADEQGEADRARAALELAAAALDRDRPRAVADRDRRVRELAQELADWDALLDGRGPQLVVEAPWDGRVGFREPAPGGAPPDGGPLLVLYRPGRIWAAVQLDAAEAEQADRGLDARLLLAEPAPERSAYQGGVRERALAGAIVHRAVLADGGRELHVACDPPAAVVRQLAMSGRPSVTVRLRRPLLATPGFLAGLALSATALGLALYGPLRRRAVAAAPGAEPDVGRDDRRAALTTARGA